MHEEIAKLERYGVWEVVDLQKGMSVLQDGYTLKNPQAGRVAKGRLALRRTSRRSRPQRHYTGVSIACQQI
jgi:hypothetical protein